MARLLTCANETLIDIFKSLDTIDSAIQLAISCRRLYWIFDTFRLEILKHIILHSKTHMYDIVLCHLNDAFHAFSSAQLENRRQVIEIGAHPSHIRYEECLKAKDLSSGQVWDILARWHGLKLVHRLYTCCTVHNPYKDRIGITGDASLTEEPILDILELFSNAHGPDVERTRFASICHYRLQSEQNDVYEQIYYFWLRYDCFQESLETLEAYDFVYGFLAQNLQFSSISTFEDWIQGEDSPFGEYPEWDWNLNMKGIRLALNPADILELLALTSRWKREPSTEWPTERKTRYFRRRGVFCNGFPGDVSVGDIEEFPDTWLDLTHLERACFAHLQSLTGNPSGLEETWTHYRTSRWQTEARGNFKHLSTVALGLQKK
ncbi:hypothetical protein SLS56_004414 [Neofusicoccum ribis]|uniref:F-box domain-containing protein n=1 Tax=Neofusicoccum ribis TaxID=45134 RepID=A0ABR3SWN2_9PEZI